MTRDNRKETLTRGEARIRRAFLLSAVLIALIAEAFVANRRIATTQTAGIAVGPLSPQTWRRSPDRSDDLAGARK